MSKVEKIQQLRNIFKQEYHEKKGTYIDCMIVAYNMAVEDCAKNAKSYITEDNNGVEIPVVSIGSILKLKL